MELTESVQIKMCETHTHAHTFRSFIHTTFEFHTEFLAGNIKLYIFLRWYDA